MFGKNNTDTEKKQRFATESEENPVPIYRAYGVTRREYPILEKIKKFIIMFFTVIFMGQYLLLMAIAIIAVLALGNLLLKTLIISVFSIFIAVRSTRTIRIRVKFNKKLKKLCKKNGYTLAFEQNFVDALLWSEDRLDFTVDTGNYLYQAHFLTVNRYNSGLTLAKKGEIWFTQYRLNNKFTIIFDLKPKKKTYNVFFPDTDGIKNRKVVNCIIINPSCKELFYKDRDGIISPTGSGAEAYGMTAFTGTGFIETVKRNEESINIKA